MPPFLSASGCLRSFPQGSFTLAMWIYPTPGLSSGLGTAFSMNTATGDNVMSLSLDRGRNIYEYKVRPPHRWAERHTHVALNSLP